MKSDNEVREILKKRKEQGYLDFVSRDYSEVYKAFARKCGLNEDNYTGLNGLECLDRISSDIYGIRTLDDCRKYSQFLKLVKNFILDVFGNINVHFIVDAISIKIELDHCRICENLSSEKTLQNKIIDNFKKYFPNYIFIKSEYQLKDKTRIDILAKDLNGRDVIIELKSHAYYGNTNPQLLHYGSFFKNPILIGVNHNGEKLNNITYIEIK